MAYQNTAENLSPGPNAMVIPFPTQTVMTKDNVIDTRAFPSFLKDITEASKISTRSARRMLSKTDSLALVFDVGSYTVVLAESANQIPEAINRVPKNKRPSFTPEFLEGMDKLYPNQPIAVCCFDGKIESEPLLWWYVPTDKTTFFVPTMDAHDGKAPVINDKVHADHVISVGSNDDNRVWRFNKIHYSENIPDDVRSLLPNYAYGKKLYGMYDNQDTFVKLGPLPWDNKTKYPKAVRGSESSALPAMFYLTTWQE